MFSKKFFDENWHISDIKMMPTLKSDSKKHCLPIWSQKGLRWTKIFIACLKIGKTIRIIITMTFAKSSRKNCMRYKFFYVTLIIPLLFLVFKTWLHDYNYGWFFRWQTFYRRLQFLTSSQISKQIWLSTYSDYLFFFFLNVSLKNFLKWKK